MPRDMRAKGVPVVIMMMMMMMMGLVGEISVVEEIVVEIEYLSSIHVAPEHQSPLPATSIHPSSQDSRRRRRFQTS